ncbi:MAG: U32 family peptidase, partial [Christensenellaceae bacterium]|nr:U32 family peptidase [Christensenellaceae bacterium]
MQNKFGQKIELLAPAGNFERLKVAFHFGADAVYLGGKEFGLRARSGNFDEKELENATEYAHKLGKKVYVTVNIFAKNADFDGIKKYAKFLNKIQPDAVIVSDLGVLKVFHDNTNLEIHISTQANITNKYTAMQYVELGAKRVILARELPLADIAEIAEYLHGRAIVEVFVHGAMCISYSGRCLLSNYMVGRESNRGDCAQPCRYKYALVEEKRPNEYYPIAETDNGTYILNSRDLCLINHIRELADAGVGSFKIEGRMKSEYYVGGVTNAYRRAIDSAANANTPGSSPLSQNTANITKANNPAQNMNNVANANTPTQNINNVANANKFDFVAELEKLSHRP